MKTKFTGAEFDSSWVENESKDYIKDVKRLCEYPMLEGLGEILATKLELIESGEYDVPYDNPFDIFGDDEDYSFEA